MANEAGKLCDDSPDAESLGVAGRPRTMDGGYPDYDEIDMYQEKLW